MIGHYLLTLTAEQEDRVLTRAFRPICTADYQSGDVCLLGCATAGQDFEGAQEGEVHRRQDRGGGIGLPAFRYEALCYRFGTARTNEAIRNRILENRARRTLTVQKVEVAA